MTNTFLYIYWGILYIIGVVLGFVSLPGWVGLVACFLFFLPPTVLLYRYHKAKEPAGIRRIRNLSVIWLATALFMLILNIAVSVSMSAQAGKILYYALVILTSPMICGGYWVIALFLWACLLMTCLQLLKKSKT